MAYTQHDFSRETFVSPEIYRDFQSWHEILLRWNAKINLVSQTAMDEFWFRHALDSWQLIAHLPETDRETESDKGLRVIDLGSGGGFPALALAIYFKHKGSGHVTLVESVGKKANFLRTVIRELSLPASVECKRAESLEPEAYDIVSARAFAPLERLLGYAAPFWGDETRAILLKGQNIATEISEAKEAWGFNLSQIPSKTDPEGVIVTITDLTTNR